MYRVRLGRLNVFLLSLVAAYLVPLGIPNVGINFTYFFIMSLVLFAWFMMKWETVKSLPLRGSTLEVILGAGTVVSIYAYKVVTETRLGLLDMLIIFAGAVTAFYGLRAFRLFWVPTSYGIALLAGYQLETVVPNFVLLQNWMASVMTSSMHLVGIAASVNGQYVRLSSVSGPILLNVESDCTGVQGIIAFGLLSTMSVLDIKAKPARLAVMFAVGFIGAFLINIVRLFGVFLAFEFLGTDIGNTVHVYLGYTLFIVWVLVFWSLAFKYLMPKQPAALAGIAPTALTTGTNSDSAH